MVHSIEKLIRQELNKGKDVIALRELECINRFPRISLPWDEWLIYSSLKKWGTELYLYTTSPRFSLALPIVSVSGLISEEEISLIAKRYAGSINDTLTYKIDNLDDLDKLIIDDIDLDDIDIDDMDIDDMDLDDIDIGDMDIDDMDIDDMDFEDVDIYDLDI